MDCLEYHSPLKQIERTLKTFHVSSGHNVVS